MMESKNASDLEHPIQPLIIGDDAVLRFKQNAIVRLLLDLAPIDMNGIAAMPFDQKDREQFAQLIGYPLNGFAELPYVRRETIEAAEAMHKRGTDPQAARAAALDQRLKSVRAGMRKAVAELYGIHPDDLRAE